MTTTTRSITLSNYTNIHPSIHPSGPDTHQYLHVTCQKLFFFFLKKLICMNIIREFFFFIFVIYDDDDDDVFGLKNYLKNFEIKKQNYHQTVNWKRERERDSSRLIEFFLSGSGSGVTCNKNENVNESHLWFWLSQP